MSMPDPNKKLLWSLLVVELAIILLGIGGSSVSETGGEVTSKWWVVAGVGLGMLTVQTLAFLYYQHRLLKPIFAIHRGLEIILRTNAAHEVDVSDKSLLGDLPDLLEQLGTELGRNRTEVATALKTGAETTNVQKSQLEKVIEGLKEGVIVCDRNDRITLYNPSAVTILDDHPALGLKRSIFDLLPRTPIEHSLQILHAEEDKVQANKAAGFVCSVVDEEIMLRCHLAYLGEDENLKNERKGFVITFEDVTARQMTRLKRNRLLTSTLQALRGPMANLRAAAENIVTYQDMGAEQRIAFVNIIQEESCRLSAKLDEVEKDSHELVGDDWETTNIYSSDLVRSLARRLSHKGKIEVTMTGVPMWMTVDSHSLIIMLDLLMQHINVHQGVTDFDLEVQIGENTQYLDLAWQGQPLSSSQLSSWRHDELSDVVGKPTVDEILQRMGSEAWSLIHPRLAADAMVRIPLPGSIQQQTEPEVKKLPPRPINYDFSPTSESSDDSEIWNTPLSELNYVVFDTETTGLHIEDGDQVISIAGVRVVNKRILSGEIFDQLVNPGRKIPKESIVFHGITDEMVKDAPEFDEVLPRFHSFVQDSVLVAHNAWFDMKFLRSRAPFTGLRFTNPVLDTLMLSVCVHGTEVDQSLDGIIDRLGIDIFGRHTALGDSMATAKLLLALIEMLEPRGIITLKDAVDSSRELQL